MAAAAAQQQPVWLGLAGELVGADEPVDHYTTRVGGRAAFPGAAPPAAVGGGAGLACGVCGRPLALVLQAYAPHPAAQERTLMVWGCVRLGCGKAPGAWRALRCQLPDAASADAPPLPQQPQQRQQQQHDPPPSQPAPDPPASSDCGFGAAGDDWGAPGPGAAADDPFDFSDLTSSLEATAAHQQAAAAAKQGRARHAQPGPAADEPPPAVCCRPALGPALPEFHLYSEQEPGDVGGSAPLSGAELAHVQELLAAYRAAEAAAAGGAGSSAAAAAPAAPAPGGAAGAGGGEGGGEEAWGGEGYEKPELRGVERGYLKFSRRLARRPQQCARYALGGALLWPRAAPPRPAPCGRCGGPRAFELQLTPALIQLTIEAAHMAHGAGLPVDRDAVDGAANWDWATVAVFTCAASCGGGDAAWEEVALVNEQDCHTAPPPPPPPPPGGGGDDDDGDGGSAAPDAGARAPRSRPRRRRASNSLASSCVPHPAAMERAAAHRLAVLAQQLSLEPREGAGLARQDCSAGDSAAYQRRNTADDDIVIVAALRTPLTKAKRGGLKDTDAVDLLAAVFKAVLDKTKLNPADIGDIVVGSVLGPSSQRANEARIASFFAGIPEEVPVRTVNRQCSSGLQAIADVAAAIKAGYYTVGLAAGVETMSANPMAWEGGINERVADFPKAQGCLMPMGVTSENVAAAFGVSRKVQDEFAARSHRKAAAAQAAGRFRDEIVPVATKVKDPKTGAEQRVTVTADDGIRPDATAASLGTLRTVFKKDGTTTAGNSSQVTDGAAAVLLMTRREALSRGLPVMAVFRGFAAVGVDPAIMGIGPAVAIPAAVAQAGLALEDIDVYEINEAFASQAAYSVAKLGLDPERVNPNGGAIALGHPLGATGARLTATLLHEMARRGAAARFGVVSMCIGSGMGAAAVFEAGGEAQPLRNAKPVPVVNLLSRDAVV
ncbi:PED1 [Scenedesmus sp. PABB004]|nr:PED1 [Scenedesmus sp. PABB004]